MLGARSDDLARDSGVVKRVGLTANDLTGFMPLSGNDQKVAGTEIGDRSRDRPAAVADLDCVRSGRKDRPTDFCRRLASRIVVCHVNPICQAGRYPSHQRTLAGIAIAAAAEQGDEPATRMRAQCRQHGRERVRRVRVVDDDRPAALALGDELQPTGDTVQMSESLGRDRRRARRWR